MKGQSRIIQFILFFLAGLTVFLAISQLFKAELDVFGSRISTSSRELFGSLIAENFIYEESCLSCDSINVTINPSAPESIALQATLTSAALQVLSYPNLEYTNNFIHNVLSSVSDATGQAALGKPIILSFIKTQNILRVSQ